MQNRLREVRNKTNLTLSSYSRMIGIPSNTLSQYETGTVPYLQWLDQEWYQAECLECGKVFRILSKEADEINCCPFCKEFHLSISKVN